MAIVQPGEELISPGKSVSMYIQKKWGGKTRLIPTLNFVVTGGTNRILKNNPRRMYWMMTNLSSDLTYVGFDPTVGPLRGLLLSPLGGSISCAVDEDGELVTYEVWANNTLVNSILSIWEIETI